MPDISPLPAVCGRKRLKPGRFAPRPGGRPGGVHSRGGHRVVSYARSAQGNRFPRRRQEDRRPPRGGPLPGSATGETRTERSRSLLVVRREKGKRTLGVWTSYACSLFCAGTRCWTNGPAPLICPFGNPLRVITANRACACFYIPLLHNCPLYAIIEDEMVKLPRRLAAPRRNAGSAPRRASERLFASMYAPPPPPGGGGGAAQGPPGGGFLAPSPPPPPK